MTQIYIISGTSWTVPSDWSNINTIETIGGGGGGQTANVNFSGSGGGGGGYSKTTDLAGLSGTVTIQVGSGGAAGTAGGDTWFNGATLGGSSVAAKGGQGAVDGLGGAGGAAGSGINGVYSGGAGGISSGNPYTGGGGGGAAGPNGNGGAGGGPNNVTTDGAGGGGGNGGGSDGVSPNNTIFGGNGGNGNGGAAGGAGDTGTGASDGSAGTGGGGGGGKYSASYSGGNGAAGSEFDDSHGSGGGGGYPESGTVWGVGGTGGNGVIVITYTPAISATIVAESRNAMEHQAVGRRDAFDAIEFGRSVPSDVGVPTEGRREIRCDGEIPIEPSCAALRSSRIPLQWTGSLAFYTDALMPFEAAAALHRDTLGFVEFASVTLRNVQFRLELLNVWGGEALLAAEASTNGARISADGPLCLEWIDPPSLLIVAPERLLRSPGRVRMLAAPSSIQPLRGH